MHYRLLALGCCAVAVLTVALAAAPQTPGTDMTQDPDAQWKEVNDAMKKGLPKTAIEKLGPIIERATADKRYAEAVKAIGMRISMEGNIQGNKPEEKIVRMRAEINQAPAEMKPIMEAVLANWYWHYFQQNRWRFTQRTQTAAPASSDFTTWDLKRILAEVDHQFELALAGEATLKATPIASYDDLLVKGNTPDSYRPTLYDFVVNNALEFYSAGEQAGSKKIGAFDLLAASPIFGSTADFVNWKPDTEDAESPILKGVLLFQELLRFHQADQDQSALLDADLARINFGNNHAYGEDKTDRYQAALKRFHQQHDEHVISARATHHLAQIAHAASELTRAHKIASEGLTRHPESVGGRRCYNLIQQIEAKSMSVATERVWNAPEPTIAVTYRNLNKVHFRLVKFDFAAELAQHGPDHLNRHLNKKVVEQLFRSPAAKAWAVDLQSTDDYAQQVQQCPIPADVAVGSYVLIASSEKEFSETDNTVNVTEVWRSDLAMVIRTGIGGSTVEGFMLDAVTGAPLVNVNVQGWWKDYRADKVNQLSATTDRNGLFRFSRAQGRGMILLAKRGEDSLSSAQQVHSYGGNAATAPYEVNFFFADRSIYRPGQTVNFKGIMASVHQDTDSYKTIAGRSQTIIFSDVNGKEIERVKVRTNDYGSFSGSVTAPRDRLTGSMRLHVEGGNGMVSFNVEEYKRPKFIVKMDAAQDGAKLGDEVTVPGKATAYTGAAIGDAKVSWRVVREVRYPNWWYWRCWWMSPVGGNSQEIARGVASTKANGSFDVRFVAKPDLAVSPDSEPTFRYTVYADVTDTTGETRSATGNVSVGYTTLAASMSAANWLTESTETAINVRTQTLGGTGKSATTTLEIYSLKQPTEVARPPLGGRYANYYGYTVARAPQADPSNPNSWERDELVLEQVVETDASGHGKLTAKLKTGFYRVYLTATDENGKSVTAELPLKVLAPEKNKLELKIAQQFEIPKTSVEPGEEFTALWGSGYDSARVFVEIEHRGKLLQSFWSDPQDTQLMIRQKVTEQMRGGFSVRTTMVRENRAYLNSRHINVPWTNKQLTLRWEHFVSKLGPAEKKTWTAVISGPDGEAAAAEMVAAMYDASLDAFKPHSWMSAFNVFRNESSRLNSRFENQLNTLRRVAGRWTVDRRGNSLTYRRLPSEIAQNFWGYAMRNSRSRFSRGGSLSMSAGAPMPMSAPMEMEMAMDASGAADDRMDMMAKSAVSDDVALTAGFGGGAEPPADQAPQVDLSNVSARTNLNETAFFFPSLVSGDDGTVRITFTMPEALTEWKFMGFAHDKELRAGLLTGTAVTSKDLMVQPNPPRFLREGDSVEFTVKVSNQSAARQTGTVALTLADARTEESRDQQLGNTTPNQNFDVPTGESKTYTWRLSVPDNMDFLTFKAVGSTGKLSDGETGYLPVLSRRVFVTESLPLPIRGKETKEFVFEKLADSANSDTLQHQSLTVQMVSNPSWYAVMALPYLMEYPHQCSEQTFSRLYANSLARHIAGSDPKIHRVFQQWRGTDAVDSPLEKNQDLKSVMLEETPWFRQAKNESQARRNVGILFDDNRLDAETSRLLNRMSEMQNADGAWPWFPGGPSNHYITQYIVTGFGRLRHLGTDIDVAPAVKALRYLDMKMVERYDRIKIGNRDSNHLSSDIAFYLYGRSFFRQDQAIAAEHREAFEYWKNQAKKFWLQLANRQSQAHLAVALKRYDELDAAKGIMASIKERSVSDDEMGMFWRDLELSWWWFRAPIETQAMMIEAFDEVVADNQSVEDCKVWLLKQKQTQDWKTTKATADAVYALLLRGTDLLASDALVQVDLKGETVKPENVEAGTGFYEQRFVGSDVSADQAYVTVKKTDDGVAWGSVHWQYFEDISKITPHDGNPLKLTKQLFVKKNTDEGPTLVAVDGPVEVGDELVVRIVLRTDRDMEYVHMKDHRGSGTEPTSVLSRYKFQDGLAYYQSTRDTASHFYIDYLPKGTFVFEYSTRVQLRGQYQTGMANIQCMYAPEFNSHSESLEIKVK